ncbi:MAG: hypothetical protein HRT51_12035 [Colwellia sp.]|nr:hypothetical protein [Colwellia sp.]
MIEDKGYSGGYAVAVSNKLYNIAALSKSTTLDKTPLNQTLGRVLAKHTHHASAFNSTIINKKSYLVEN